MTMLIKLNDDGSPVYGFAPIVDANFRALFPDTTFPSILLPTNVEPHGFGIYDVSTIPTLQRYQKVAEGTPQKDGRGIWMQTWIVADMTDSEKIEVDIKQAGLIRSRRGILIQNCDWTQLSDSPLSTEKKAAWTTYRQALRDISKQPGFPWEVTWPTRPV